MDYCEYPPLAFALGPASGDEDLAADHLKHARPDDDGERKSHESKPRLSKEQQDLLERHFARQQKPSTLVKKGFANDLNVPIEKINNWFQNRRAKVKQDAKKHQFKGPFGIHPPDEPFSPTYVDSSFYTQMNADPAHTQFFPTDVQLSVPSNAIDTADPRQFPVHHLNALPEPLATDNYELFQAFFGLDGQPDALDDSAMYAYSKQFAPPADSFDAFSGMPMDLDRYNYSSSTSASLLTRSSHDSSSLALNSLAGPLPAGAEDIPHLRRAPTPSSAADPSALQFHLSTPLDSTDSLPSWSHPSVGPDAASYFSDRVTALAQPQPQSQLQHLHMSAYANSHDGGATPQLGHQQPLPAADASRTSPSVESTGSPDALSALPATTSSSAATSRPGSASRPPPSSLAARRQRRPAALGTAALRSASYTGAVATSPTAVGNQNLTADMKLRRIQSATGFTHGRIQKSNLPAQRSPLHFSFTDAAAAAAAAVSAPSPSGASAALSHPALPRAMRPSFSSGYALHSPEPSTPLSYDVTSCGPPSLDESMLHIPLPPAPFADDGSDAASWTNESSLHPVFISPPETPLEATQMAQLRLDSGPTGYGFPAPHSAPAWQQSFALGGMPHDAMPAPVLPPQPYALPIPHAPISAAAEDHTQRVQTRTPPEAAAVERPEAKSQHTFSLSKTPSSTLSARRSPDAQATRKPPAPPPSFSSMQSTFVHEGAHTASPPKAASPKTPAEFIVHEYAPRQPADTSKLAPPRKPAMAPPEPKNYTFQNQHPEHFSSP